MGNNPLSWIDPFGLDKDDVFGDENEINPIEEFFDNIQDNLDALEVVLEKIELEDDIWPNNERDLLKRLFDIAKTETGKEVFDKLQPGVEIKLTNKDSLALTELNRIELNLDNGYFEGVDGSKMKFDLTQILAHELAHLAYPPLMSFSPAYLETDYEQRIIDNYENKIVEELYPGRELRKEWGGKYD